MSQRRLWLLLWLLSPALALDDRPCYLGFSSDADDDAAIAVLALPVAWHRAVLRARATGSRIAKMKRADGGSSHVSRWINLSVFVGSSPHPMDVYSGVNSPSAATGAGAFVRFHVVK